MTAKYGEGAVYELPKTPEDINNPTVLRTRAGTGNIFDFKTWSPRLGLAWTLTEDRKTVLRAHAGRYFAPMSLESLRRIGPDMDPTKWETSLYLIPVSELGLGPDAMINPNVVRAATRLLAGRTPNKILGKGVTQESWSLEVEPGTRSPYTDQLELSVQRQLGSDFAIEATAIHKKTKNLIALKRYNTDTGELYEWVARPFKTYTGYNTQIWEIALKDYNKDGKIDVKDAKYVLGHTGYRAGNVTSFDGKEVARTYDGLQLVFTKRYSHRSQALAALNWNHTSGVAPRTVDQNWYIDGPMIMDTPWGATVNDFQNNLSGPLPMTPKWMLKVSGSYTLPRVETDVSLRYRFDSGRPFWPVENIPGFAGWMSDLQQGVYLGGGQVVADNPTRPDWMPSTSIVDFGLSKTFKIGTYATALSLDVLNLFNENSPNRVGFKQADYGRVYSIVTPRVFRAGVKFLF
jgi:hypothetical protein